MAATALRLDFADRLANRIQLVIEAVPASLAKEIHEMLRIPTIGIGAGPDCDGQVLVLHDILGLFDRFTPKFVKRYANLKDLAGRTPLAAAMGIGRFAYTALLPVTGISLPLVSYGGSFLLVVLALLGIVQNIYRSSVVSRKYQGDI